MKNKKVTYLLLVLSVVIWGTAGWKVYKAFNVQVEQPVIKQNAKNIKKDSITLLLNYRDPFLGNYSITAALVDTVPIKKKTVSNVTPPKKIEPEALDIQFKGIMNIGKIPMAILQKADKILTLKTGDEVDGYKITKIEENKIVLNKERKKYEIPIQ